MKKHLVLLPMIAGLALTGCDLFGKKDNKNGDSVTFPDNFLKEFRGYELATSVEDGGRYLLGVYRVRYDQIRFANGDYHWGTNSKTKQWDWFPYYMGTIGATVEGACEVEVKMVGNNQFTLQVFAEGKPWHQKYIGIYGATSGYDNKVTSIGLFDSPNAKTYTDPKTSDYYSSVATKFEYYTEYNGVKAYAPAIPYLFEGKDEEATPKFLGIGHASEETIAKEGDYIAIEAKSFEGALDYEAFDLAHLYKKK